jgi:hypothetical protein
MLGNIKKILKSKNSTKSTIMDDVKIAKKAKTQKGSCVFDCCDGFC